MGAVYWQLNDTWPVASWSSLDYGGNWKLLHHLARRFFQPVNVVAIPEGETLRLVAINDGPEAVDLEVEAFAVTLDGANTRPIDTAAARVGIDAAVPLTEFPLEMIEQGEIVAFRWKAADGMAGGDVFTPVRWKNLDLRDPKLAVSTGMKDGRLVARVSAETAVAFFATLEADRPGRFSTNAVAVFPGFPAEISFTPDAGNAADATLTVRDLYSSYA